MNEQHMKPSNDLGKKFLSDTYWRVQQVCMKVQGHSSLESPLEYNQDQTLFGGFQKAFKAFSNWTLAKKLPIHKGIN